MSLDEGEVAGADNVDVHGGLHPVAVQLHEAVVRVGETKLVELLLVGDEGGEGVDGGLGGAAALDDLVEHGGAFRVVWGLIIAHVSYARSKK
jgi:hypothetical protein